MTLVKSLYSGDPDVIRNTRTCMCLMYIQGASLVRAIRPTSQFKSICLAYALGRPCRGPNVVIDDGQVDAPNSQLISCLDSSLGRVSACGAGERRFAPRP
jgi:hypothetical protein